MASIGISFLEALVWTYRKQFVQSCDLCLLFLNRTNFLQVLLVGCFRMLGNGGFILIFKVLLLEVTLVQFLSESTLKIDCSRCCKFFLLQVISSDMNLVSDESQDKINILNNYPIHWYKKELEYRIVRGFSYLCANLKLKYF